MLVGREEEEEGMVLLPAELPVSVDHQVVTGLEFKQFVTALTGTVKCLGEGGGGREGRGGREEERWKGR